MYSVSFEIEAFFADFYSVFANSTSSAPFSATENEHRDKWNVHKKINVRLSSKAEKLK